jgi:hypothetical protein
MTVDDHSPRTSPLVERNIDLIEKQFEEDPSKILVAVQLTDDQEAHLAHGLHAAVRRRLIPLPVIADLISRYNNR